MLHILESSKAGASSSDCLVSYAGHSFGGTVLPLYRDAAGVFYCPGRQGWIQKESEKERKKERRHTYKVEKREREREREREGRRAIYIYIYIYREKIGYE